MITTNLRSQIKSGAYDEIFEGLYTDVAVSKKRYAGLCGSFIDFFGNCECRLFSAPGRTEIGGNHTDHQHGMVLAASVDTDVIACVSLTDDNCIKLKSFGYSLDTIDINSLEADESEFGKSSAIIRGICRAFKDHGYNIGGFNAYTTSNVPKGSGLSSSAAFEVLVATILNICYNDGKVSPKEIAAFSQYAETVYFGKPCGLLDQTASAYGSMIFVDFNDPKNPISERIDVDIDSTGYTLFAVNTGGNHAGLTGDYAAITTDCAEVCSALGKEYLASFKGADILSNMSLLKEKCSDRAILRAMHVTFENERVAKQKSLLEAKDFEGFLALVRESGDSSANMLQNLYSISRPTEQGITLGIALAKTVIGDRGAARVHGGGFAGTIQAYVPNEKSEEFIKVMESAFGEDCCTKLKIRHVGGVEIK